MIAYKYFQHGVREIIEGGSVKLGSLSHFRELEKNQIGDDFEGTDERIVDIKLGGKGYQIGPTITTSDGNKIISGITHGGLLEIEMKVTENVDALIYSATTIRDDDYWRTEINPPYDDCIKINDFYLLAERIEDQLRRLCGDTYEKYEIDKCYYQNKKPTNDETPMDPDPFRKQTQFVDQNEARIAFKFFSTLPKTQLVLQIDPTGVFSP